MQSVIVFCQDNLRRAAWLALLEKQPGISAVQGAEEIADFAELPALGDQGSVFVDMLEIEPEFVRRLAAAVPGVGLLLLAGECDIGRMTALVQGGALGIISSSATTSELVQALHTVGRGEIVLPRGTASKVMLALARGETKPVEAIENLTKREQEVMNLLARGLTNKDIAQNLFLSVRTVEAHLGNIYGKLGITSRTVAVLWALNHGYDS